MDGYLISEAVIADSVDIFRIINEAYEVESGDTGIAFKNTPRLLSPLEDGMEDAYKEGRILKVVENSSQKTVATLLFEHRDNFVYFGPFAVSPDIKGRGIGKKLLQHLKGAAESDGKTGFEIRVANHRTDLLPMYQVWVSCLQLCIL